MGENKDNLDGMLKDKHSKGKVTEQMASTKKTTEDGFLGKLLNRSKVIDKAVEGPKSSPSVTISISTGGSTTSDLGELPKPKKGRKYDDYLQKYVDESDWKSPQDHAMEADQGFKKAKEK